MNAARALLPLAEFKRQFLDLLSCVENQTGAKTWLLEELVPQGWTGAAEDGEEDPHLLFPSWIPRTNVATLIGQALQCVAARPQGNTTDITNMFMYLNPAGATVILHHLFKAAADDKRLRVRLFMQAARFCGGGASVKGWKDVPSLVKPRNLGAGARATAPAMKDRSAIVMMVQEAILAISPEEGRSGCWQCPECWNFNYLQAAVCHGASCGGTGLEVDAFLQKRPLRVPPVLFFSGRSAHSALPFGSPSASMSSSMMNAESLQGGASQGSLGEGFGSEDEGAGQDGVSPAASPVSAPRTPPSKRLRQGAHLGSAIGRISMVMSDLSNGGGSTQFASPAATKVLLMYISMAVDHHQASHFHQLGRELHSIDPTSTSDRVSAPKLQEEVARVVGEMRSATGLKRGDVRDSVLPAVIKLLIAAGISPADAAFAAQEAPIERVRADIVSKRMEGFSHHSYFDTKAGVVRGGVKRSLQDGIRNMLRYSRGLRYVLIYDIKRRGGEKPQMFTWLGDAVQVCRDLGDAKGMKAVQGAIALRAFKFASKSQDFLLNSDIHSGSDSMEWLLATIPDATDDGDGVSFVLSDPGLEEDLGLGGGAVGEERGGGEGEGGDHLTAKRSRGAADEEETKADGGEGTGSSRVNMDDDDGNDGDGEEEGDDDAEEEGDDGMGFEGDTDDEEDGRHVDMRDWKKPIGDVTFACARWRLDGMAHAGAVGRPGCFSSNRPIPDLLLHKTWYRMLAPATAFGFALTASCVSRRILGGRLPDFMVKRAPFHVYLRLDNTFNTLLSMVKKVAGQQGVTAFLARVKEAVGYDIAITQATVDSPHVKGNPGRADAPALLIVRHGLYLFCTAGVDRDNDGAGVNGIDEEDEREDGAVDPTRGFVIRTQPPMLDDAQLDVLRVVALTAKLKLGASVARTRKGYTRCKVVEAPFARLHGLFMVGLCRANAERPTGAEHRLINGKINPLYHTRNASIELWEDEQTIEKLHIYLKWALLNHSTFLGGKGFERWQREAETMYRATQEMIRKGHGKVMAMSEVDMQIFMSEAKERHANEDAAEGREFGQTIIALMRQYVSVRDSGWDGAENAIAAEVLEAAGAGAGAAEGDAEGDEGGRAEGQAATEADLPWRMGELLLPTLSEISDIDTGEFAMKQRAIANMKRLSGVGKGVESRFAFDVLNVQEAWVGGQEAAAADAGNVPKTKPIALLSLQYDAKPERGVVRSSTMLEADAGRRVTVCVWGSKKTFTFTETCRATGKECAVSVPFAAVAWGGYTVDEATGTTQLIVDVDAEACDLDVRKVRGGDLERTAADTVTGLNRTFSRITIVTRWCKMTQLVAALCISYTHVAAVLHRPGVGNVVEVPDIRSQHEVKESLSTMNDGQGSASMSVNDDYHVMTNRASFLRMKGLLHEMGEYLTHRYSIDVSECTRRVWFWPVRCAMCGQMCGYDRRGVECIASKGFVRSSEKDGRDWGLPSGSWVGRKAHAYCAGNEEDGEVHGTIAAKMKGLGLGPPTDDGDEEEEKVEHNAAQPLLFEATSLVDGMASAAHAVEETGHAVTFLRGLVAWFHAHYAEAEQDIEMGEDGVLHALQISDEEDLEHIVGTLEAMLSDGMDEENEAARNAEKDAELEDEGDVVNAVKSKLSACGCCGDVKGHGGEGATCTHEGGSCSVCLRSTLECIIVSGKDLNPDGARGTRAVEDRGMVDTRPVLAAIRAAKRWLKEKGKKALKQSDVATHLNTVVDAALKQTLLVQFDRPQGRRGKWKMTYTPAT